MAAIMHNRISVSLFLLIATGKLLDQVRAYGTQQSPIKFRVMTFNTWQSGRNVHYGLDKIVHHIQQAKADIVALQEVQRVQMDHILNALGPPWVGIEGTQFHPDWAIISRFPIEYKQSCETDAAVGVWINLGSEDYPVYISVWSVHAAPYNYAPYAACGLGNETKPLNDTQLMQFEANSLRFRHVIDVIQSKPLRNELNNDPAVALPIIIMGTFNVPSHLDWSEDTRQAHCGHSVLWPESRLMEIYGFYDAYRLLHPNIYGSVQPGNTWSTVEKLHTDPLPYSWWTLNNSPIPEPQDRIDYIYYRSARLRATYSETYAGNYQIIVRGYGDTWTNDWPSDHYAVIADFELSV